MNVFNSLIFVVVGALLATVGGCGGGGSDVAPVSAVQLEAVRNNQEARRAYDEGDYTRAAAYTGEALRLYHSIEHVDGIAMERANLSATLLATGDSDGAVAAVAPLFTASALPFTNEHRAEAGYRTAAAYFRRNELETTAAWLARAEDYCRLNCRARGQIENLRAALLVQQGDIPGAISAGHVALATNRKAGDRIEEANALRTLGDAFLAQGDAAGATQHYGQALEIDKALVQVGKIHVDLLGMGRAAQVLKQPGQAREYFQRAYDAAQGAGDVAAAQHAQQLLHAIAR